MAFAETQELVVKLSLKGDLSSKLRGAIKDVNAFDRATSRTQKSLGKFGSNIGKAATVGLAATAAGFVAVVDAAKDYESAFAGVRKTVDATDAELAELSKQFRALSKEIPISAAELARLGEAGGALGVPTAQLKEFVRVTALLGVTTDLTSDQAAESLGVLTNILHLTGDEYSAFASSLVALGNAGASTESAIIEIAQRAGAAGELIGLASDQMLGFASAAASLDPSAVEASGTALQKFFIDTTKFAAKGGDELKILAKISGTTAKAFKKAYEKDAGKALQKFLAGLGKLNKAGQLNVLEDLGFTDARITRVLLGLANNTELVASQMDIANKAFTENTALTKEANTRFETFDSQLQITKNTLTDMAITIGSKLLPKLTPLLKRLNTFVTEHQGDIEKFGDDLATGFEKFADALGGVDWKPFLDGLKLTRDVVKVVIDGFMSLPEDVRKLVIAGAAINKVTGGLITSVGKDLAGLGIKLFLEKGQTPANPLWVAMAGAPGAIGGVAGAGGIKGALGTAANIAAKVTIVGMVAEVADLIHGAISPGGGLEGRTQQGTELPADKLQWPFGPKNTPDIDFGPFQNILGGDSGFAKPIVESTDKTTAAVKAQGAAAKADAQTNARIASDAAAEQARKQAALIGITGKLDTTTRTQLSGVINQVEIAKTATTSATAQVKQATDRAAAASRAAGQAAASAIKDKDLSVKVVTNIKNYTKVSIKNQLATVAYSNSAGAVAS